MKPRIYSAVWRDLATGVETRRWHVKFYDSCGCEEEEDFHSHEVALRFVRHITLGASRWEFVG